MKVTVDIGGLIQYMVLNWQPPDDPELRIGLGFVAYLSEKDPAHVLIPAFVWHDAAYSVDSDVQWEKDNSGLWTWPRWRVDKKALDDALNIAKDDNELIKDANTLYLTARLYGANAWENKETV